MTQYALPISDILVTNWVQGAGDGDGSAFDELDEGFGAGRGSGSGPDDATTYWNCSGITATDTDSPLEERVSSVTDPVSSTGHIYRSRSRKSSAA